jgi:hypothetical protein
MKLGDSNQDSYVNASQADIYFGKRVESDEWDALTTIDKEETLKQATKDIDRFNFIGEKYYDSQVLAFPRQDHDTITGNCGTPITKTSFRNTSLYSDTYNKYPTNYFKYGTVHITSATPLNNIRVIESSNALNGSITASAFSATPTTNTKFIVFVPIHKDIQDAQCEQALFILKNAGSVDDISSYRNLGARSVSIGDVSITFDNSNEIRVVSPVAKKLISRFIKRRLIIGRR